MCHCAWLTGLPEMILSVRMRNRKLRNIRPSGALGIPLKLEVGGVLYDVRVYRFLALVICPFPAILFSYFIIYFNNGFHLQCFRIYSLCTPSSLSRPRSHCGDTNWPKSQMNEMVNLIPTCIVSSKKKNSRMILLNSEKHCIYMYRGRRRRAAAAAAKKKEEEDGGGGGWVLFGCNYD